MSRDNFMDLINDSNLLKDRVIYLRTINSIWMAQQLAQQNERDAAVANAVYRAQQQQGETLMTYRYFADALRVIGAFLVRDPMTPLASKLERLVTLLWTCTGLERCRLSMGAAANNAIANNAAAAAALAAPVIVAQTPTGAPAVAAASDPPQSSL